MLMKLSVLTLAVVLGGCATRAPEKSGDGPALMRLERTLDEERPRRWAGSSYTRNGNKYLMPIYVDLGEPEWYCSCPIPEAIRRGEGAVDADGCDLGFLRDESDATTLSWEHVVPQSWLKAANRTTERRSAATGDPYNLAPAVERLNEIRKHHPYAEIEGEGTEWSHSGRVFNGACDIEMVKEEGQWFFEPPNEYKGDLARITLYMYDKHGFKTPDGVDLEGYLELMKAWAAEDPMSRVERSRLRRIGRKVEWDETPADY